MTGPVKSCILIIVLFAVVWFVTRALPATTPPTPPIATVAVPPGQKLLATNWILGNDLRLLTRPLHEGEAPETYTITVIPNPGSWKDNIQLLESRTP